MFQAQREPSTACCVTFCRLIIMLPVKVCLPCLSLIKVTNMFEIPHQMQKSFSPVSSINSSKTDIALPAKTSKPNFVTVFVYFGNSSFDYLWNFFVTANREAILVVTLRVWRRSFGGTGRDWVNSAGYIHWYIHIRTHWIVHWSGLLICGHLSIPWQLVPT